MNAAFSIVFLLAATIFLLCSPDAFLPAMLSGAQKAATLSLSLISAYCIWLGFFKVLEQSGILKKFTKRLLPAAGKLFHSQNRVAIEQASCNLAANILGLPGAPTPAGIRATGEFLKDKNDYGADLLFVLNATSLQLFPATVISLRLAAGAAVPADILLPTLLSTLFSTVLGAALVCITTKRRQKSHI